VTLTSNIFFPGHIDSHFQIYLFTGTEDERAERGTDQLGRDGGRAGQEDATGARQSAQGKEGAEG